MPAPREGEGRRMERGKGNAGRLFWAEEIPPLGGQQQIPYARALSTSIRLRKMNSVLPEAKRAEPCTKRTEIDRNGRLPYGLAQRRVRDREFRLGCVHPRTFREFCQSHQEKEKNRT